jgi:hypothetical protein
MKGNRRRPFSSNRVAFTASAGRYVGETVTVVITQGESIFFATDKACPNWHSVNSSRNAAAQARAFS